jgi:ketosteroid isomerase-like protein
MAGLLLLAGLPRVELVASPAYADGPYAPLELLTRMEDSMSGTDILQRMVKAMNSHDLDGLVDCFTADFVSELPIHPRRSFAGRAQMRSNWERLFAHVPDLEATVRQAVTDGDQVWSEWEMRGNTVGGGLYLTRGVAILGLRGGSIASVRFYLDDVDLDDGAARAS